MEDFRPNPEYLVKMPEAVRIQQRLGHVAMHDATQTELTRILSRRAGDSFSAENFVGLIADGVAEHTRNQLEARTNDAIEYSEEYIYREQERFLVDKMPKFITQLLTNVNDRSEVLGYWFGVLYEKIHADEPINESNRNKFIQDHIKAELKLDPKDRHNLSRKQKKPKKDQSHHNETRPHTTAWHRHRR